MSASHVTHLELIKIADLRPTQVTVGMEEVREKCAEWRKLGKKERHEFLKGHVVPTVLGPKGRHFIIDHHHLARALHDEGHSTVWAGSVCDLSHLEKEEFWMVMQHRSFVHPYDARGQHQPPNKLPRSIADLVDDPYRSLAGEARRKGAFAKTPEPFAEFMWADFFRRRIPMKRVRGAFRGALAKAVALARMPQAAHLPGFSGRSN